MGPGIKTGMSILYGEPRARVAWRRPHRERGRRVRALSERRHRRRLRHRDDVRTASHRRASTWRRHRAPASRSAPTRSSSRAAKLPRVEIATPSARGVGRNTLHSDGSSRGSSTAYVGLVDGLVERLKEELGFIRARSSRRRAPCEAFIAPLGRARLRRWTTFSPSWVCASCMSATRRSEGRACGSVLRRSGLACARRSRSRARLARSRSAPVSFGTGADLPRARAERARVARSRHRARRAPAARAPRRPSPAEGSWK